MRYFLVKICSIILITQAVSFVVNAQQVQEKSLSKQRQQQLIHILKQDCGSCHGMTLKGGLGSPLLPKNLKLQSTKMIANTILNGRPGTAMPPWKPLLSKQEIYWLAKQLKQGLKHEQK
ncbi:MAG: cytochrome c class I NirC [Gammaproteobacteria bacterium]|nr:MAG: cytochrome c class I NirC [Gammaproteobacteria bacterium]